jgi:hypothetical protein
LQCFVVEGLQASNCLPLSVSPFLAILLLPPLILSSSTPPFPLPPLSPPPLLPIFLVLFLLPPLFSLSFPPLTHSSPFLALLPPSPLLVLSVLYFLLFTPFLYPPIAPSPIPFLLSSSASLSSTFQRPFWIQIRCCMYITPISLQALFPTSLPPHLPLLHTAACYTNPVAWCIALWACRQLGVPLVHVQGRGRLPGHSHVRLLWY